MKMKPNVSSQTGVCLDRALYNRDRAPDTSDQALRDHKIPQNASAFGRKPDEASLDDLPKVRVG